MFYSFLHYFYFQNHNQNLYVPYMTYMVIYIDYLIFNVIIVNAAKITPIIQKRITILDSGNGILGF